MKYIEFPELSRLAQALCHDGPECSVRTRIEAYSCKPIGRDKRLARSLEHAYADEIAHSPPLPSFVEPELELATAFGSIDKHASRKTLYQLIATLNVAFPDHDFSAVRPSQFSREPSGAAVLSALSTTLVAPNRAGLHAPRSYSSYPPNSPSLFPSSLPTRSSPTDTMKPSPRAPPPIMSATHPVVYRALDDVIGLADCDIYAYEPDIASDPHGGDDDDEDVASVGDEDEEWNDDDEQANGDDDFPFDAEFDEVEEDAQASPRKRSSMTNSSSAARSMLVPPKPTSPSAPGASPPLHHQVRMHRRGALLWSAHWFFFNRKLKRVVYITVWSRTRRPSWGTDSEESDEGFELGSSPEKVPGERFVGWAGAAGAGARAMGLRAWE